MFELRLNCEFYRKSVSFALLRIFLSQDITKQWYYNNGHQEVVTSIHFVKIKILFFCKKICPQIRTQTSRSSV